MSGSHRGMMPARRKSKRNEQDASGRDQPVMYVPYYHHCS
jgi:hypothetical protein